MCKINNDRVPFASYLILILYFFFFFILDLLCDWHIVRYIVSHSAHPKLSWYSKIFEHREILFWKFWWPNYDGWRFGCIIEMHCGHSHCTEWCILTDCGKFSHDGSSQPKKTSIFSRVWRFCCCILLSFVLFVQFLRFKCCCHREIG